MDINGQDDASNTPLHMAARHGHRGLATFLLEKGADPDAKNDNGQTPLDLAAAQGHQKTAVVILNALAKTEQQSNIIASDTDGSPSNYRQIFIHDVDTMGTPVVLDLASDEMLAGVARLQDVVKYRQDGQRGLGLQWPTDLLARGQGQHLEMPETGCAGG